MRLAAITLGLDWSFRQTCSQEKLDLDVARRYIAGHIEQGLALLDRAGQAGADLALMPEYFRGSELFLGDPAKQRELAEPIDGPTARLIGRVCAKHRMFAAASYYAHTDAPVNLNSPIMPRPAPGLAETGLLVGRDGAFLGHHTKLSRDADQLPAPSERLTLWPLDIGVVGMLICSDAEHPHHAINQAQRGMKILLIPGCGFMGKFYESFVLVRALETKCTVVYADEDRAMIVSGQGEVLARTNRRDELIVAEVAG